MKINEIGCFMGFRLFIESSGDPEEDRIIERALKDYVAPHPLRSEPKPKADEWEHIIVDFGGLSSLQDITRSLDGYGREGWELVSAEGQRYTFNRRRR